MSLYPEVNIACWSIVNYISSPSKAFKGSKTNCDCGINSPIIADINGILNVLFDTGTFWLNIWPFCIWHCGTVGDIKGYLTPLANIGDIRFVNPVNEVMFGIFAHMSTFAVVPRISDI